MEGGGREMVGESAQLRSLYLDTEKGICKLNGIDISSCASELHLDFENGLWSLAVIQKSTYTASAKNVKESV